MKKKIFGLAMIAISLAAFNGMAQSSAPDTKTCKENVCKEKADCKMKKDGKKMKENKICAFEGLNLTDAQKAQLKELNSKRNEARKAQGEARKQEKQRNDSAIMAQRKAEKKAYLEEVKAIIGPDQYVIFLENMVMNGGGRDMQKAAMHKGMKPKMERGAKSFDGKDLKKGKRTDKRADKTKVKESAKS